MKKYLFSIFVISAVVVTTIAPAFLVYGDFTPPVANFSAIAKSATTVTLSWDTPQYANAASFDIRFSTSPITEANFDAANRVTEGVPLPISAITQSMDVTGLAGSTTYYFAIRVVSNSGAFSSAVFSSATTGANGGGGSTGGGSTVVVIPPVANLSATSTETAADVFWDTPQFASATSIELRFSTSVLNDSNFSAGTLVSAMPFPIANTRQTVHITGLASSTTYYFGIRLVNVSNNSSIMYTSVATLAGSNNGGGSTGGGSNTGGGSTGGGGGNFDGRVGVFVNVGSLGGSSPVTTLEKPIIIINDGAGKTDNQLVSLSISAKGCTTMTLSNTADFAGSVWEPFATSSRWILSSGNGEKTVYGKCSNASNVVSPVGTSSIVLVAPEVASKVITAPHTKEITIASGVDALISITPNLLTVTKGDRLIVMLTANPNGTAYHARAELSYPVDSLTLEKVEYASGWTPEFGDNRNVEDAVHGTMIKSGNFAGGFNTPKHFATLTFVANEVGDGRIDIATKNINILAGLSQTTGTGVLGSAKDSKKYLFANILSIVGDGNYFAFATLLSALVILYMVYLASRDKKRHGKAFIYHGFRKQ